MATEIERYVIEQVKARRLKLGLSQAALATEAHLSYGFVGNVESKKHRAKYNINHLNALANVLHCSIKDFFPADPFPFDTHF